MRALVKIGDKRAVPTLMKILTTSADDQDFLLNQKAALGLAEFRDPSVDPGAHQGPVHDRPWHRHLPGVPPRAGAHRRAGGRSARSQLLQEKNADVQEMAAKLKFDEAHRPGVVPHKAAILLGDLRAKKAVPALDRRACTRRPRGDEHRSALIALGYIATPAAVDAILADLKDGKADPAERASAADALYLSGDRRAVPTLLEIAKSGYVTTDGQKASDLRASAAIALARIAGKETYERVQDARREGDRRAGRVRHARSTACRSPRSATSDLACYGKKLNDPSWDAVREGRVRDRVLGQRQAGPAAPARAR